VVERCSLRFQNVGDVLQLVCHPHLGQEEVFGKSTRQKHMYNFVEEQVFVCHVYRRGDDGKNLECMSHWPMGDWGLA
jgi:hypothetical protein